MKKIFIILSVVFIALVSFVVCNVGKTRLKAEQMAAEKALRDSIAAVREMEARRVADSIRTAEHIKDVKNSIRLTSYYLSGANSCGGRDIHFNYQNLSKKKTIKYLDFSVTFYNAVGDLAYDEIRGYCSFSGRDTGPIKPMGYSAGGYWGCAIYNYQAKKMTLNSIRIEYMDGSVLKIDGVDLELVKGYKG